MGFSRPLRTVVFDAKTEPTKQNEKRHSAFLEVSSVSVFILVHKIFEFFGTLELNNYGFNHF